MWGFFAQCGFDKLNAAHYAKNLEIPCITMLYICKNI